MQLRTLALLCSIVGFLYSGLASALGLGEITLKSQYNQPLNAEIRLLKVRDLSEEEILAALASREDFRRAGVERVFFLTGLNFEVVLDNPSNPFIRVTSRRAVTEPYLNFLLEVQWPSGRLLREYTLLLDLPVFTEAAPSNTVVSRPTTSTPATVRSEPAPTSSGSRYQSSSSRPVVSGPEPVAGESASSTGYSQSAPVDSYRVRSGDTLWEIAESVRPDRSVSVHQTMIALQEANPEAFVGGNINRLKNGKVLRVPSTNEINNISYNRAVSTVRQQNQSWSSKSNNRKAVLTSAAPTTTADSSSAQPEGRLTLAAADSGQGDVRSAGASGSGESLQNELSVAKDELSKTTRENSELKSRIADLESQIETMERLVSATNDQLKALQVAAQNRGTEAPVVESVEEAVEETVESAADAVTDAAEAGVDAQVEEVTQNEAGDTASVDGLAESAEESVQEGATEGAATEGESPAGEELATESPTVEYEEPAAEEPVVETPPVATPPVTPPAVEKPGFDLVGIIKDNLIAVGGALAALLVGILVLLRLREKPEEADYGEFDLAEGDDEFESEELDQPEDIVDETSLDLDEEEDVEAQTEDVVAEADIYVSLGQEDKAIELLQKEIQQNPDNADARLGLLKIYAKAQNAEAFDEQYAQLLPLGNVYANDQAMALRKDISDVEPFDTDQYSADVDGEDAFESLNLGDDLDDELNLDLDLDSDTVAGSEDMLAASDNEAGDDFLSADADIDADLDLDSELNVDIGELSLDLDDVDGSLDDLSLDSSDDDSLSLSDLDDDGELSLDLDLDTETEGTNLVDEMSADLDKLDVEDTNLNDLEIDIDGDLNALDDDLSLSVEDGSTEGDLEFDLDFESADATLDLETESAVESEPSLDEVVESAESIEEPVVDDAKIEDELDLDAPPLEDIDLASLDEEIDAMTADLDETLPLDEDEPEAPNLEDELAIDDPFSGSSLDLDSLDEESAEPEEDLSLDTAIEAAGDAAASAENELDVTDELSIAEDEFAALEEGSEGDIDILAQSEMDDLVGSDSNDDVSVDDIAGDDVSVSSMMDDASISEDDELDFLEASDEVSTKLDLAKAYIDMGDREGAEDILNEVIEEGNDSQKTEAEELKRSI